MAHRKWKETKLQPSMLPGSAVPGSCLVSLHFLWAILCPQAVLYINFCDFLRRLWEFISVTDSRSLVSCSFVYASSFVKVSQMTLFYVLRAFFDCAHQPHVVADVCLVAGGVALLALESRNQTTDDREWLLLPSPSACLRSPS